MIPEPVVPDMDNDWLLTEVEVEAQIVTYLEKKGQPSIWTEHTYRLDLFKLSNLNF